MKFSQENNNNDKKLTGIFKAIVTDTSPFKQTGKIRCRISSSHGYYVTDNLLNNYDQTSYSKEIEKDVLTSILMPFGGGNNYGLFKCPPVNSVGLVTFIDNNPNMPCWIGGLANTNYSDNNTIIQMDIPSDKLDNDESLIYNENSSEPITNIDDENSFIIRTKTNTLTDFSKPESMNWSSKEEGFEHYTENVLIMNKNKYTVRHILDFKNNRYEDIVFNQDDENDNNFAMVRYHIADKNIKYISLNQENIMIKNSFEDKITSINLTDECHIIIKSEEGESSKTDSQIMVTPTNIQVKSGDATINLSRVSNDIQISADTININANDKLLLGQSGYFLVASPNPNLAFTLEDGSMLTSVGKIGV